MWLFVWVKCIIDVVNGNVDKLNVDVGFDLFGVDVVGVGLDNIDLNFVFWSVGMLDFGFVNVGM